MVKLNLKKLHCTYQWDRDALEVASGKKRSMDGVSVAVVGVNADESALVVDAHRAVDIDTVAHIRVAASMSNLMTTMGFQLALRADLIN